MARKNKSNVDRTSMKFVDLLLTHGMSTEDVPEELKGKPVHIYQVNFDVPPEKVAQAQMGAPPYAVRAKRVEDLVEQLEETLEQQWKEMAETFTDPDYFERVWKAIVETLELDKLNKLIKEHNTFYPIEANLTHDNETGKWLIGSTEWKPKKKVTPERLFEKFPPDLARARGEQG